MYHTTCTLESEFKSTSHNINVLLLTYNLDRDAFIPCIAQSVPHHTGVNSSVVGVQVVSRHCLRGP